MVMSMANMMSCESGRTMDAKGSCILVRVLSYDPHRQIPIAPFSIRVALQVFVKTALNFVHAPNCSLKDRAILGWRMAMHRCFSFYIWTPPAT
jgi:hypothetical protein